MPLTLVATKHATDSGWPDWAGTAPAWAAVGVALLAVSVSALGIWTALRSYKENNWQTKVQVARLVYCNIEGIANDGDDMVTETRFTSEFDHEFGKELFMIWDGSGVRSEFPDGHVAGYHVQVTNYSNEPVGGTWLKVLHPKTFQPVVTPNQMWLGTLNPKTTKQVSIYVPRDWEPGFTHQASIEMTFTDSAGQSWKRVETDPPKEDD